MHRWLESVNSHHSQHSWLEFVNPIMLRSLTDEESWTLFLKKAKIGEDSLNSPVLIHLKKDILKKCGGSPLAIIVLGRLLSTTELSGWSNVIEQLRKTDLRESSTVIKPAVQQSSTTDLRESSTEMKPAVQELSTTESRESSTVIKLAFRQLSTTTTVCLSLQMKRISLLSVIKTFLLE